RTESARDLMLAVDLSGSMSQRDMLDADGNRQTRMDAVKEVLDDFISRREGDRLGIIVFGTQAFVQTPFTRDHELVRALLDQVQPRMPGPQTMIGDAIGLTIRAFESSEARDRVLVLLTDGADTGSRVPPQRAAEMAAGEGIIIHTVTMGDAESTGAGRIDLAAMEAVASETGGSAFSAGRREELARIYDEIDLLTPEEIETVTYRPTTPLFHWPLGAAVSLVLLYHGTMLMVAGAKELGARHA
ncbi:MAG: VWA domain-containing protein, partial [Longimicrobiales bacterium]